MRGSTQQLLSLWVAAVAADGLKQQLGISLHPADVDELYATSLDSINTTLDCASNDALDACGEGCMPPGAQCCDDGTFCAADETCVAGGGCLKNRQSEDEGCEEGFEVCDEIFCIPEGSVCCGSGFFCDAGFVCNDIFCDPEDGGGGGGGGGDDDDEDGGGGGGGGDDGGDDDDGGFPGLPSPTGIEETPVSDDPNASTPSPLISTISADSVPLPTTTDVVASEDEEEEDEDSDASSSNRAPFSLVVAVAGLLTLAFA